MSASGASDSDSHPRKRFRKGTHSCLQCRRRKVRCVFESNSLRCENCIVRDSLCLQQEAERDGRRSSEPQTRILQRLQEVETLLSQVLERLPVGSAGSLRSGESTQRKTYAEPPSASSLACQRPSTLAEATYPSSKSFTPCDAGCNAPLLTLFDNSVLKRDLGSRDGSSTANLVVPDSEYGYSNKDTRRQLLGSIKNYVPNVHDLTRILGFSRDSWRMWRNVFPEDLESISAEPEDVKVGTIRDFIYKSLNTDSVAIVTKVILSLAVHLQQLPRDFNFSECTLHTSSEALQEYYMSFVGRCLDQDDGFVETMQGVESLMIQAEFYVNLGKPKKIWSIFRRAVNTAHLLGLHHASQDSTNVWASRRTALWRQIWQNDRELSLVLGLPYAVSEVFLAPCSTVADRTEEIFLAKLGIISGHIIERNHNHGQSKYHVTSDIDLELEECKDLMPAEWWALTQSLHMSDDALFSVSVMKMKYHNIRKLLHLPFMLKSYEDPRYDCSRLICLESAREMIKIYRTMRDEERPLLKMCDMMDFQAFTAAMILVVELLARSQFSVHYDPQQETSDWNTVNSIIRDFKRISATMVCSVPEQAAHLLEDFYITHHDPTTAHQTVYQATIPYFGKLRVVRGPCTAPDAPSTNTAIEPSNSSDPNVDPLINFDAYFQTLPGALHPWQELETDWAFDLGLADDWSWSLQGMGT